MFDFVYGLTTECITPIVLGVLAIAAIIGWCRLAKRLGHEPYMGLLMIIPVVNVVVFFYWAFTESPNEKRLKAMQQTRPHADIVTALKNREVEPTEANDT